MMVALRAWRLMGWVSAITLGACAGQDEERRGEEPAPGSLVLAQELYYAARYDSAALAFEAIRSEAEATGDVGLEASATMWLGLAARMRAVYDSAVIYGEKALDLQLSHALADQLPRSFNALGLLAWEEYRLAEAESLFVRSIEAAEAAAMPYAAAVARGNLGMTMMDVGDYEGAREGLSEQLEVSLRYDSVRAASGAATLLAALDILEGDPESAVRTLRPAIETFRELGDRLRLQNALAQLGEAYADLGEPQLAFAAFDTALAVAREIGEPVEVARNLDALAALHQRTGGWQRARELYEVARAVRDSLGQRVEAAWSLRNVAAIHAKLGDLERARSDAEHAAAVHAEAGMVVDQVADALLLAEIAWLDGDRRETRRRLDEALNLAGRAGGVAAGLPVQLVWARIELEDGDVDGALRRLSALEPDLDTGSQGVQAEGFGLLARAHAQAGDFDEAVRAGSQAVGAFERIRSRFGSSELRATFVHERLDAYGDLAGALLRLGRLDEAFAVIDAARGRGITAHLASARSSSAPVASVAEGDRLLRRINSLMDSLEVAGRDPYRQSSIPSIREEIERARGRYENSLRDARELLGADAPLLGLSEVRLADVQRALSPGEALLEYLVTRDRVWLIVVTREDARPLSVAIDTEDLASRVRIARDLLASPQNGKEVVRPVVSALYDLLLGDARRSGLLADVRLLTLVPHTVLNYLPYPALLDPATDRYLVEDFEVRYLPSAAALTALANRGPTESIGPAALFAPKDDELPHTRVEIARIDEAWGDARRYHGSRASEVRVRAALERQSVVHIATHGIMNAQNPMFSRVELSGGRPDRPGDDGRLEVHEVLDMDIAARLVFLSGCETGVGAAWATVQNRGEDHTTLERAFLYAGAANVVATLWPIDDQGAAEFSASFYASYRRESTPAASLAAAQRRMLSASRWRAPYYWAGFRLSGRNEAG